MCRREWSEVKVKVRYRQQHRAELTEETVDQGGGLCSDEKLLGSRIVTNCSENLEYLDLLSSLRFLSKKGHESGQHRPVLHVLPLGSNRLLSRHQRTLNA